MKHKPLFFFACIAIASAIVAAPVREAHACSGPICYATESFVLPQQGTIPSNAPGLAHYAGREVEGTRAIKLEQVAASGAIAVPFTQQGNTPAVLVPTALTEGAHYRLEVTDPCPSGKPPTVAEFDVGKAAPLPTALGAARVAKSTKGALSVSSDGPCTESIDAAQAEIELDLDAAAAPWKDLFHYTTLVDGKVWRASEAAPTVLHPAGSWKGRARDLVYAACASPNAAGTGIAPGTHTVTFKASIAGTSVDIASAPVDINLACQPVTTTPTLPEDAASGPESQANASCHASPASNGSGPLGGAFVVAIALGTAALRRRR